MDMTGLSGLVEFPALERFRNAVADFAPLVPVWVSPNVRPLVRSVAETLTKQ